LIRFNIALNSLSRNSGLADPGQFLGALLQRGHDLRMLSGDVVLLGWILRDVVKLD
jgi:hypothetical protein